MHPYTQMHILKPVKMGFCRNPNLKDLLVHSRITYPPNTNTGNQSLPSANKISSKTDCDYCPLMDKSGTCFSSVTIHKYIVPSRISCKLNNLVHLLTCTCCQIQYVDETYCSLKERLSEHLHDIGHECNPNRTQPLWLDTFAWTNTLKMIWKCKSLNWSVCIPMVHTRTTSEKPGNIIGFTIAELCSPWVSML